jgi:hypothetical protein
MHGIIRDPVHLDKQKTERLSIFNSDVRPDPTMTRSEN